MMKMKATREGEEVMNILHDVIAAKGFESASFFKCAKNDIPMLPKLEGTVHVNMALIVKFMADYFFNPKDYLEVLIPDDGGSSSFIRIMIYSERLQTVFSLSSLPRRGRVGVGVQKVQIVPVCSMDSS